MRLRITTAPALSTPCIWKTDFAISRPIVLTSPMDGSPQCGLLKATTLGHFDAAEWAPSTASKADICSAPNHVCFTPNSDRESGFPRMVMSALPPKADSCSALAHVRFGPEADIRPLFDHLVSPEQHRWRHG